MPRSLLFGVIIVLVLALIPPAVVIWARNNTMRKPRIHLVQDMDVQHKVQAQRPSRLFADERGMRPPVQNTVARGELQNDRHLWEGVVNGEWATTFPDETPVTRRFVEHGKERFEIYCATCHGYSGYGDGMVHQRASTLMQGGINGTTWVQPKSFYEPAIIEQPVGQLFNTISNGIRTMPAYGAQIPVEDRWAIVAYVKALQKSRNATPADLPEEVSANDLPVEVIEPPAAPEAEQQNQQQQQPPQDGSAS